MSGTSSASLRILVVHRVGHPAGGVESYVETLASLLAERGHQVARRDRAVAAGAELDRLAPDVIHVHHGALDLDGGASGAIGGVPVVRTLHDLRAACPGANRLDRHGHGCTRRASLGCAAHGVAGHCDGLSRWPHQAVARVRRWSREVHPLASGGSLLVASSFMRGLLERQGIDPARLRVVPYPVPRPTTEPAPPSAGAEVVFAGRLVEPDKGLAALVDIVARTPASVRFAIAGAGPAASRLARWIGEAGLERRARLLGPLDHDATLAVLARAAMVVLPSRWPEPSGLVGLEAASLGRPVVAFDVGGVSEWLRHGESGYLVPAGDTAAFAARVAGLHADPEARDRMGRVGRAVVREHHDPQLHCAALEERYVALRERRT